MADLLLTDAERQRFAEWLAHEIASTRGIVEQMEKMQIPQAMVVMHKTEISAMAIVRNKLVNTESMTIGAATDHPRT